VLGCGREGATGTTGEEGSARCQEEEQGVRAACNGWARQRQAPVGQRVSREEGGVWLGGAHLEEREGARGPAQEKEKQAGPKGIMNFLIYSNNFQMSSNFFDQKVDPLNSKNFK
jgi:hypothetical protein